MKLNLDSETHAEIVKNTLSVDQEPQPKKVHRELTCNGPELQVSWTCQDLKLLRTVVSAFYLNLELVVSTILELTN